MGSHESKKRVTDEWLTPHEIIQALGEFNLDPCSPVNRPWNTAQKHYTIIDDGLKQPWEGRVWLNPPYSLKLSQWLEKLSIHKNGIALIFARTEIKMFFNYVWSRAVALLFIYGRITFYRNDGKKALNPSGAPSVLIAYDNENAEILRNCGIKGKYVRINDVKDPVRCDECGHLFTDDVCC